MGTVRGEIMNTLITRWLPTCVGLIMLLAPQVAISSFMSTWDANIGDAKLKTRDYIGAEKYYRKAAEQGDARGEYGLGELYAGGKGVQQDYAEAAKWYQKAADHGHSKGQYKLGLMYSYGQGVQQDYIKAMTLFKMAGKDINYTPPPMGYTDETRNEYESRSDNEKKKIAMMNSYRYKDAANFNSMDYTATIMYYRNAVAGDARSQYKLGELYVDGKGVQQDYSEAAKWYQKAAEQGNPQAQVNLGNMYRDGKGVQQDYAEAAKWYRKAAEQGDSQIQLNLANMYRDGDGLKQDYTEAAKWYQKAAEQGNPQAQVNLGNMYRDGKGVQQDYTEAAKWYRKAAEQGDSQAQFDLANMYNLGQGVQKNIIEAGNWYRKAADQGNYEAKSKVTEIETSSLAFNMAEAENEDIDAMKRIGNMYVEGIGVQKNDIEAEKWYMKAEIKGDKEASNKISDLVKYSPAINKRDAEQGNIESMVRYGDMCIKNGNEEAIKWYKLASNKGNLESMVKLGGIYNDGSIIKKDKNEAIKWYKLAAIKYEKNGDYNSAMDLYNKAGDKDGIIKIRKLMAKQEQEERRASEQRARNSRISLCNAARDYAKSLNKPLSQQISAGQYFAQQVRSYYGAAGYYSIAERYGSNTVDYVLRTECR